MFIRAMRLADVDRIHCIAEHQFAQCWSKPQFAAEITHPHACHWVAEDEVGVWAYICVRVFGAEAEILSLATHPDRARRGLAKQLLDHALSAACAAGCRQVYLEVRASNLPAQNLYLAAGFERVTIRKRYYGDNDEDAQVLARGLANG